MKNKLQKTGIKIMIAILSATILLISIPQANTVYAAGNCGEGWNETAPGKCEKPLVGCNANQSSGACNTAYEETSCPDPTYKKERSADGTTIICTQLKASTLSGGEASDLLKKFNAILILQRFLNQAIWPILILTGSLMDNSLLFGSGMEERLRDIWIPIRNLVNILFVIVLVGIALYNVLGIGEEGSEYSIKSMLPKIIIGIIAVNFSFLAIKVFLDTINVLTVSVFSLPSQVNEGITSVIDSNNPESLRIQKVLCANLEGYTTKEFEAISDETVQSQTKLGTYRLVAKGDPYKLEADKMSIREIETAVQENRWDLTKFREEVTARESLNICDGKKLSDTGKNFLKRWGSRNAALAMALNMGNIIFYPDLHPSVDTLEKTIINSLFSVLLYLIYVISFVALFVVLLARLVILWISIALSPLILLMMTTPALKEKMEGLNKITEQFVKNAVAPLIIAITMTIGWIMLKGVQGLNIMGQKEAFNVNIIKGIPVVGVSTLQDLIISLGTVGIVWVGVFAAAEGTLAQALTDKMKGFLTDAGTWIGTLPFKHIPFIPIALPGKEGKEMQVSGADLLDTAHEIFRDKRADKLTQALGFIPGSRPEDLEDIDSKKDLYGYFANGKAEDLATEEGHERFKEWVKEHPDEYRRANEETRDLFKNFYEADTEEKRLDAVRKIKKHDEIRKEEKQATKEKPEAGAAKGAKPPAKGAVIGVKEGQSMGGVTLSDSQANEINTSLGKLGKELDKDTKDMKKEDVKTEVTAIIESLTVGGKKPDGAALKTELRDKLGDARYDTMLQALGEDGKKEIEKMLETPPPAPAAGGVPSGSTPASGAPAGGTPPPAP